MLPSALTSRALQRARWHRSTVGVGSDGLRSRMLSFANSHGHGVRDCFASGAAAAHSIGQGRSYIGYHKVTRHASSFDGPPESTEGPTRSDRSGTTFSDKKNRPQYDSFGISNFRKMLQYQKPDSENVAPQQNHRRHNEREERNSGPQDERHDFKRRRDMALRQPDHAADANTDNRTTTDFKRRRDMALRQPEHAADANTDNRTTTDFKRRDDMALRQPEHVADTNTDNRTRTDNRRVENKEDRRPSWRQRKDNRSSRPYQKRPAFERSKDPNVASPYQKRPAFERSKDPNVATSEWILVSNVPPMSNLSDMFQSLDQIIDHEMQKGIIDLDALENSDFRASSIDSFNLTREIENGSVPLWTPPSPSDSGDHEDEEVYPTVQEARVHLSYRARPIGWFIRLPNRSVVHAVINHIRRAEKCKGEQEGHLQNKERHLQGERAQWRDGLWRGVMAEHERKAVEEESKAMLEDETDNEKDLMWGYGLEEEESDESVASSLDGEESEKIVVSSPDEEEIELMDALDPKDQNADVDDYLQKYFESHPYPTQSTEPNDAAPDSQYHLLKCGLTALNVREFSPDLSESFMSNNDHPPWEQHSFHLSPQLKLSDSVVRVETSDMKTSEHDIRFLFRGYDLENILPESEKSDPLPPQFTGFPESLGWNMNDQQGNVKVLVKGGSFRPPPPGARQSMHEKEWVPVRERRHAFLVRFASPADARMAVRDKEGSQYPQYQEHYLSVKQYPTGVNEVVVV